jgi:hypothetical protein
LIEQHAESGFEPVKGDEWKNLEGRTETALSKKARLMLNQWKVDGEFADRMRKVLDECPAETVVDLQMKLLKAYFAGEADLTLAAGLGRDASRRLSWTTAVVVDGKDGKARIESVRVVQGAGTVVVDLDSELSKNEAKKEGLYPELVTTFPYSCWDWDSRDLKIEFDADSPDVRKIFEAVEKLRRSGVTSGTGAVYSVGERADSKGG